MTQFRGLHNPERHTPYAVNGDPAVAWCRDNCEHGNGTQCAMVDPCRCCLAAEVEALRDEVNLIELSCGDWKKRALAAEAQVQAVRDLCARREAEVAAQPFLSAMLYVTEIWTALGVSE